MKKALLICVIALTSFAASAQVFKNDTLDILNKASRGANDWWGATQDNARRQAEADQAINENAWFQNCMIQTRGDAMRCRGGQQAQQVERPPEPRGSKAYLVHEGEMVRTVTGSLAHLCTYEIFGQRFQRAYTNCPNVIYVD